MSIGYTFTFLCLIAHGAQLNAVNVPSSCSWQISDFHPTQDNMDQEDINVSGKLRLEAENINESAIKAQIQLHVSVVFFTQKLDQSEDREEWFFFWDVLSSAGFLSGEIKSNLPPQRKKMGGWDSVFPFSPRFPWKQRKPVSCPKFLNRKTWDKIKLLRMLLRDKKLVWNCYFGYLEKCWRKLIVH